MGEIRINNVLYSTPIQKLTQAEYDALGDAKNTNGVLYAITDGEGSSSGGGTSKPVELTKAQYEALGDSVLTDGILYAITDGEDLTAKNLAYDGSVTGLGSTVQEAIDKQNKNLPKKYKSESINDKVNMAYHNFVYDKTTNIVRFECSFTANADLVDWSQICKIPSELLPTEMGTQGSNCLQVNTTKGTMTRTYISPSNNGYITAMNCSSGNIVFMFAEWELNS